MAFCLRNWLNGFTQAHELSYKFYETGGAIGDREKVWDVTGYIAVKIVRVWKFNCETQKWDICRSSVKLGDDEGKIRANPLLANEEYISRIEEAILLKTREMESLFSLDTKLIARSFPIISKSLPLLFRSKFIPDNQ